MAEDLSDLLVDWPVEYAGIGVTNATETLGVSSEPDTKLPVASISKTVAAYAGLVAFEEGTIDLDDTAGPQGSTVRHLLSHASGLAFDDGQTLAPVGTRRIYSNTGIERFANHLQSAAGMPFAQYQHEAVLSPLGMTNSELIGTPAHGLHTTVTDLLAYARELLAPTLITSETLAQATTPQFPSLAGVLPGVGKFDPNPWGLGFELRSHKAPHWTGTSNSIDTFGHFGGSGSFLWVDPAVGLACCAITDRDFGPWALEVWPTTSDRVLDLY